MVGLMSFQLHDGVKALGIQCRPRSESHLFPGSQIAYAAAAALSPALSGSAPMSQGCVPSALWACFICVWFLHPIMYKKCPPVFHASGEKREAVTLEMKRKRMAQLWAMCVLSTCKEGQAEL